MRHTLRVAAGVLALAALASAQPAPSSRPVVAIDLSTPAAALKSYFRAEQALDLGAISKTIEVIQPAKKPYVAVVLNYRLWRHYLERQAIRRFGKEAGLTVEGHVRSFDDQLKLDLAREMDSETVLPIAGANEAVKLHLHVEADRPEGVQTDRFDFIDTFYMVQTAEAGAAPRWKLDFLRTYDCYAAEKEPLLKFEAGIFPIMANALRELSQQLEKGDFATAQALKIALADRWNQAYGDTPPAVAAPASQP